MTAIRRRKHQLVGMPSKVTCANSSRNTERDGRRIVSSLTMTITVALTCAVLVLESCVLPVGGASIRATTRKQKEESFASNNDVDGDATDDNRPTFDLLTCSADITLHDTRLSRESGYLGKPLEAIEDGKEFFEKYLTDHQSNIDADDGDRTLLQHTTRFGALSDSMMKFGTDNVRQNLLTIQSDGKFVFWGQKTMRHTWPDTEFHIHMSLFQSDITSEGTLEKPDRVIIQSVQHENYRWDIMPPKEEDIKIASQQIVTLPEGPKEYIIFVSLWHSAYQHVLIDHLGWLAYLKETYPDAMILLPGTGSKNILRTIDQNFLDNRTTYLNCSWADGCSDKIIQAPEGTALSIFMPPVSTRNIELYDKARRWIWSSSVLSEWRQQLADSNNYRTQKTIIYYKRSKKGRANKGRYMNEKQDDVMLQMVEHSMKRFNRPEQLVIFDGTNKDFEYQLKLFASASIVIGSHGGALANLLFTPQVDNCEERTKLIEFVQSSETPKVQPGSYDKTYYFFFSTMPWIETHQVFYVPPSDGQETYVDLQSFHDALNAVMSGDENESRHAISLTQNFRNTIKG